MFYLCVWAYMNNVFKEKYFTYSFFFSIVLKPDLTLLKQSFNTYLKI